MNQSKKTKVKTDIDIFKELDHGVFCAGSAMHIREFEHAIKMSKDHCGQDAVYYEKFEEWDNMGEDQLRQFEAEAERNKTSGEYGICYHSQKPVLREALSVLRTLLARKLLTNGTDLVTGQSEDFIAEVISNAYLPETSVQRLENPEFVENILTTFPDGKITRDKIDAAMSSFVITS